MRLAIEQQAYPKKSNLPQLSQIGHSSSCAWRKL